ncbi:ankyrin repeat domain-containing protein 7 [Rattus norvegicus]|uniref:Ankyrin repeat domain 7 n=1 Tax=Rattus norvegicus TaxID=10116 RepID=A0A0G2KA76_RAT|nr:ankyrin repeat domain-containing protein 7 [Rattus norvegicus]|eukprot:NP_001178941.1 ankyrin repeat domain-containing protein 7 [Rattus norvegicus]
MKKLFPFREKRKTDDSHSHSSDLSISLASTMPSLSTGGGYHLRDKPLKKLHKAASVGNVQKLKDYLERKKYDVNGRDKRSRTPLHFACANGYTNIVSLLIENQCKINVQDSENRTPLIKQAAECQQESCATLLLHHGADPNLGDIYGNTALHYAVYGQNISLANKLLDYKANLEAKNKDGYTPLLLAVAENNENMVKFLLKKGADVNASDKNHRTAIMIALIVEPTNSVKLLLQQDADLACEDIYGFTAEEYASFNGFTMYHQLIANNEKKKKTEQTAH